MTGRDAYLFTLGRDRVNLINEDDRRRVLLGLLKCLPQIALTLTRHLAHDFRTVNQEEERARLVRDRTRHERLTRSRRAIHEDTARGLDTDRLEKLRVAERELDEFANLGHLLAAATNVIVADFVQVGLLVFSLDRIAL